MRKFFPHALVYGYEPLVSQMGNHPKTATFWKLDRSAIEGRLREQAEAIGFGVEELLDRLAQSVPAFVEVLRSRD